MAKPNGPLAYANLVKQSALISPVHFAYLVGFLHSAVDAAYEQREDELARKLESDRNHIVNPMFEKRLIEELKFLLDEASRVSDGKSGPVGKVNFRDLLCLRDLKIARNQHPTPNS